MKTRQSQENYRKFNGENLPLFMYSYSSRGFPDLLERLKDSLSYLPMYLLSLYDYEHVLPSGLISSEDLRFRIWDSGGYETMICPTCQYPSSLKNWDESTYIQAANRIPWNGYDILGSYDVPFESICIKQQIERALNLYSRIKGNYSKDLLIHVSDNTNPDILAEILKPYTNEFQILGVTEKEIAPTWAHGVYFINRLRSALSSLQSEHYIPIHVFGCFDLKTVIRFTLAGADIFDGLTWLRNLFLNREVLYQKEIEYAVPMRQLVEADLELSMMLHNIREMEQLRSDLTYAIHTNDMDKFEKEKYNICELLEYFNQQEVSQ